MLQLEASVLPGDYAAVKVARKRAMHFVAMLRKVCQWVSSEDLEPHSVKSHQKVRNWTWTHWSRAAQQRDAGPADVEPCMVTVHDQRHMINTARIQQRLSQT